MRDLPKSVKKSLQRWTKIIAMRVRNGMEGFHVEHLSDKQMKQLNPIIREMIFKSLREIWLLRKGDDKQRLLGAHSVHYLVSMIPEYWEDPDLTPAERQKEKAITIDNMCTAVFPGSIKAFKSFLQNDLGVFDDV